MKAMRLTAAAMAVALLGVGGGIALASSGGSGHRGEYAGQTVICQSGYPEITPRQMERMTPDKFARLLRRACPGGAQRMATAVAFQRVIYPGPECQLPPSERPSPSQVRHMTPEQLAARCHVMVQVKHFTFRVQSRRQVGPYSGEHLECVTRKPHTPMHRRIMSMTLGEMLRWLCRGSVKTGKS